MALDERVSEAVYCRDDFTNPVSVATSTSVCGL